MSSRRLMYIGLFLRWLMHLRKNSSNPCRIIYLFLRLFGRKTSKREFIRFQRFNCWDCSRVCSICNSTLSKVIKSLMRMKPNRKKIRRILKMHRHKKQNNNKKIQIKWKITTTIIAKSNNSRHHHLTAFPLIFKKCASQFGALLKVNSALDLNKCP